MTSKRSERAQKPEWTEEHKSEQPEQASVAKIKKSGDATRAAHARWKKGEYAVRVASYMGEISLAGAPLVCGVLDDGVRVVSERSLSAALGHIRHPGDYLRKKDAEAGGESSMPAYISPSIVPFLTPQARDSLLNPIRFQRIKGFGIPTIGVDANLIADICDAYLLAQEAGVLPMEDHVKAAGAKKLIRALARVAIAALIDEATGFQVVREKGELQRLLEHYIAAEHREWMRKFPDEFWVQMFRLRNLKTDDFRKRPQYFGHLTNDIVWNRLIPGMLEQLNEVNPSVDGRRARKHHQHLKADADRHFNTHMSGVVYLMKSATTWAEFKASLDRVAPVQDVDRVAGASSP